MEWQKGRRETRSLTEPQQSETEKMVGKSQGNTTRTNSICRRCLSHEPKNTPRLQKQKQALSQRRSSSMCRGTTIPFWNVNVNGNTIHPALQRKESAPAPGDGRYPAPARGGAAECSQTLRLSAAVVTSLRIFRSRAEGQEKSLSRVASVDVHGNEILS